jgi:uncharacterized protein YjiS (DUF1127 family)
MLLRTIVKKIREYLAFQEAIATLEQADDRTLADMGLSRADIRHALRTGRH